MSYRSATAANTAIHPLEEGIHLVHSAPRAFIRRPRKPAALRLLAPGERTPRTLSVSSRALRAIAFFTRNLPVL